MHLLFKISLGVGGGKDVEVIVHAYLLVLVMDIHVLLQVLEVHF